MQNFRIPTNVKSIFKDVIPSNLSLQLYFLFAANKFLIVGGETDDGNDLATEIIDVQSSSDVTSSFGEIPSKREDAVGGLIGSTPIICGYRNAPEKPMI